MTDAPWQCRISFILPHPSDPAILMQSGESGWTLPHIRRDERIWPPMVAPVIEAARKDLALDAVILRCATSQRDEATKSQDVIYVLDPMIPNALLNARWIAHESITDLPLT